jgi:hypothetical protein
MAQLGGERTSRRTRLDGTAHLAALALLPCAACAPLVDVAGAFFPAWLFCILIGVASTVAVRELLARARLEASLGPLLVVYPSLATGISLTLWLVVYRRVP